MGWFDLWSRPKPDPKTKIIEFGRTRFDDIEDDIKELKERVRSLEEKGEWKPRFGDRVRFRHSYFGEMIGVIIDFPSPSQCLLVFRDPSNNDDTKFYTVNAEDVEKVDD